MGSDIFKSSAIFANTIPGASTPSPSQDSDEFQQPVSEKGP